MIGPFITVSHISGYDWSTVTNHPGVNRSSEPRYSHPGVDWRPLILTRSPRACGVRVWRELNWKGKMLAAALYILAIGACKPPETITLRTFSLATNNGEDVFHVEFDRRRLSETTNRLALKFRAFDKQFEFEFRRSSVFAPNAVVRMTTAQVRAFDAFVFVF